MPASPSFDAFLRARLAEPPGERELMRLYDGHGPDRLNLNDRAYIAGLHPLELWLAAYWQDDPATTRSAMLEAAAAVRQESYAWLFKTGSKAKQDKRIRILLEEEAFERIHEAWRRLGYPFDRLVPSYATSIGSSADRPEALAELVGILLADGVWQPAVRVEDLHFAENTPYETIVAAAPRPAAGARPGDRAHGAQGDGRRGRDRHGGAAARRLRRRRRRAGGDRRQDRHRRSPPQVVRPGRPADRVRRR